MDDWYNELSFYAAEKGGRVLKKRQDGYFSYIAVDGDKRILVIVDSARDLRFVRYRRKEDKGKRPK